MTTMRPPDFDAMYAADPDPWQVESSWYERRKLSVLMACLPRPRYRTGWEPGCGIGVATQTLATRVDDLTASDGSSRAVDATAARVAELSGVRVLTSTLPDVPLPGSVELVVAAEFLYYIRDLSAATKALRSACAPGGHVALLHWAHHPHDAYRSGVSTHEIVVQELADAASQVVHHRDQEFVLDVLEVLE